MQFGLVRGTVVSTRKDEKLTGLKFLFVQQLDHLNNLTGSYVVAADSVGAGLGDVIMFATGSSARQTTITKDRPVDAVVMAIVDRWDIEGDMIYEKYPVESYVPDNGN